MSQDLEAENAKLKLEVADLKRQVSTLREAGDEMWYAGRHRDRDLMLDAMEEWAECRANCRG
jgi:cell division protein FtsB